MIPTLHRGALLAVLSLALLAVACDGDDVLGPPDAARCTVGTLAVGTVAGGRIGSDSCTLWGEDLYQATPAESWTFRTAANTVYMVRLTPVADTVGGNTLAANIDLYDRNVHGDSYYATGRLNSYGPVNASGGRAQQLVFASRAAETVSLRVQSWAAEDSGSYTLEVIACPLVQLTLGVTSAPVTLDDGCTLRTGTGTDSVRAAFFDFPADADADIDVTANRTAGTASMRLSVRGPDRDVGCYGGNCTASVSATGTGPITLQPTFRADGHFTAILTQETAGTLTAIVRATTPPEAVVAPSLTGR